MCIRDRVNTGCGAQAKCGKVIAKVLFAQPRPHLDKAGVAGYRQPLGQGFTAMDMPVCAAQICARHIDLARADKAAVPRDGTGIQCRSAGEDVYKRQMQRCRNLELTTIKL